MDTNTLFKIIFFVCAMIAYGVRVPYVRQRRALKNVDSRISVIEGAFALLAFVGFMLIPLIEVFTGWLDFADYERPALIGWVGTAVFVGAIVLLWRAHRDLGLNWSATTQISEQQGLITTGVYAYIRHPIYAAHWLWMIAQLLLLSNWIAGPAGLLLFAPIYFYRTPREEQMMIDHFGDAYREYIERTGSVIPSLKRFDED